MNADYNESELPTIHVPAPRSAGLMLSYRCNASCLHCMYACSPRWEADWLEGERLERMLQQVSSFIEPAPGGPEDVDLNYGLHFTGGEPFLNFDLLLQATERAEPQNGRDDRDDEKCQCPAKHGASLIL